MESLKRGITGFHISFVVVGNIERSGFALAGLARWTECQPGNPKIAGSIPSQGTCLGWAAGQVPFGGV